jgi:TonB-linked SusC/RagA family outer membrane protein
MKTKCLSLAVVLFFTVFSAFPQKETISGRITSAENGEALSFVFVTVKGTKTGTLSDTLGHYSIAVQPDDLVLEFKCAGMTTREVPISGQTRIDVELTTSLLNLDEAIIVGYGSQGRRLLTGSVGRVEAKDLENRLVGSPDQILQGKIAGVQVWSNTGQPGSSPSVRIRGLTSVGSNQPLYLVDGMPIITGSFQRFNFAGSNIYSSLNDINPDDIQSIEVLKDASYASIYGSRAANGVIMITTRHGQKNKPVVSFNMYTGWQKTTRKLDLCNAKEYVELMNEAYFNTNSRDTLHYGYPDSVSFSTDWQDAVFRTGAMSNYQLSASGGNNKITYYLSGAYGNQKGIVIGNDLSRWSGRANFDVALNKKWSINTILYFANSINNKSMNEGLSAPMQAVLMPPIEPIYNPDSTYHTTNQIIQLVNPVAVGNESIDELKEFRTTLKFQLNYMPFQDLKLSISFGTDYLSLHEDYFMPVDEWAQTSNHGLGFDHQATGNVLINENTLTWSKILNKVHNLTAMTGVTYEMNRNEFMSVVKSGYPSNELHNPECAGQTDYASSGRGESKIASWLGRITYDYNKKYLLQAVIRADGSSRFGPNNRTGYFPAFSAAWRMGEEPFIQKMNFISELKLRVGIGTLGNQTMGDFQWMTMWNTGNNYLKLPGILPSNNIGNKSLRWEKTISYESGLDLGLWHDRIVLDLTVYLRQTRDIILERNVPLTSGYTNTTVNVGTMENKGIEFTLNSVNLRTSGGFDWQTSLNIFHNKNTFLKANNDEKIVMGPNLYAEGYPWGVFYGYKFDGVNPENGSIIYRDIDGSDTNGELTGKPDGKIDDADRTVIGNPHPRFQGGITNLLTWKRFEVNCMIHFACDFDVYYASRAYWWDLSSSTETFGGPNQMRYMLNRWQKPGDVTDVPKATIFEPNYYQMSSRFIHDASYVRLQTLMLSYSVPFDRLKKLKIQRIRIFITGQNLFTWTEYPGFDPELSNAGTGNTYLNMEYDSYPMARSVILGINLDL